MVRGVSKKKRKLIYYWRISESARDEMQERTRNKVCWGLYWTGQWEKNEAEQDSQGHKTIAKRNISGTGGGIKNF